MGKTKMERIKPFWLIPVVTILILIFQEFAGRMGGGVASSFSYGRIDPHGTFAWVSVGHTVQMLVALMVIWILALAMKLDFGFGLGDVKVGLKHVFDFFIVVLVFLTVSWTIVFFLGDLLVPDFPLNRTNVVGTLGFQLLLTGPSEEILFRALPITLLAYSFKAIKFTWSIRLFRNEISLETIITAILFSFAHIGWIIHPFSIVTLQVEQLILSFVYGIFYGVAYQKSKSIIYPMIMHSMSNVMAVGSRYILLVFFG